MNKDSVIDGELIQLVPYLTEHVPLYHKWLSDPQILESTASEHISLEDEYKNQSEWANNKDKATFLILDKETKQLVGDVNISIVCPEEQSENLDHNTTNDNNHNHSLNTDRIGELMIMIAEKSVRGKGLATQALNLMMNFANSYYNLHQFNTKISADNVASINLFEKKLHFKRKQFVEAFNEWELQAPECKCNKCFSTNNNTNIPNNNENLSSGSNLDNSKELWTPGIQFLHDNKVKFDILQYEYIEKGGTSASSSALGVDEHYVVKTLIFLNRSNNETFVVLMHGDCSVDIKSLTKELKLKKGNIVICPVDIAQDKSGYQVGGTSPFGLKTAMKIYIEQSITELKTEVKTDNDTNKTNNDNIVINGGRRGLLVRLSVAELIRILSPTPVNCKIAKKVTDNPSK